MIFDSHKLQEILNIIHPYLRWCLVGFYCLCFLYVNRIIIKDPILRKWILGSFNNEHDPSVASGKTIMGFIFSNLVALATVVAIIYSPNHLLPEYFLISILSFIAALYGIKMYSKYLSPTAPTEQQASDQQQVQQTEPQNQDTKEESNGK